MRKRKSQGEANTATGREFSSNLATSGLSFAAALRNNMAARVANLATVDRRVTALLQQEEQQNTSTVVTELQRILTEFLGPMKDFTGSSKS
jgi:hypothetical protein